jgi:hypothetical protein
MPNFPILYPDPHAKSLPLCGSPDILQEIFLKFKSPCSIFSAFRQQTCLDIVLGTVVTPELIFSHKYYGQGGDVESNTIKQTELKKMKYAANKIIDIEKIDVNR